MNLLKKISLILPLLISYTILSAQQGGLGVRLEIEQTSNYPKILEVYPNSPASKINLSVGDFITKIFGISTQNIGIDKVINKLKGQIGTTCSITVWRKGKEYQTSFIRAEIKQLQTTQSNNNYISNIQFSHYTPKFGTISFDYPSTWEVNRNDSKKQAFNENYFIQPKGQYFEGTNNQVVIRIFDPVSIMEDTKSLNCSFNITMFNKIVSQITEVSSPNTQIVNYSGKTYYEYTESNSSYSTKILGAKSPNGNLYVLAMANAPTISSQNFNILLRIANSLKGGEPNAYLTTQESVVKNWYSALSQGDRTEMEKLSCNSANQVNGLISIAEQLFGSPNSSSIYMSAAKNYDFSNLRFYTIGSNDNLAVVRICGNIIGPNGVVKSFYNYASYLGGSNAYVVKWENGKWKICQPA